MKRILCLIFVPTCILAACSGPTVEQREKIAAALEANAEASRRAETAETALINWYESQEPDSTEEAWAVFVWESADTGNRRLVRQAQGRAAISRGNAATARDNASRAWKMATEGEYLRSIVEGTVSTLNEVLSIQSRLGSFLEYGDTYRDLLDAISQEKEYAVQAEALELIGDAYSYAAEAFDTEADAWTTLAVFAE